MCRISERHLVVVSGDEGTRNIPLNYKAMDFGQVARLYGGLLVDEWTVATLDK